MFTITKTTKSTIFIIFDFCLHQSSYFLHNVGCQYEDQSYCSVLTFAGSFLLSKCFILFESQFGSTNANFTSHYHHHCIRLSLLRQYLPQLYSNHKKANTNSIFYSPSPKPINQLSSSFLPFAFTEEVISYTMLLV